MKYFYSDFRKLLFVSLLFVFSPTSFAQLTGVKTIPGNYATIEAAITDLNIQGAGSGGVTFNVAAGHTETFTTAAAGQVTASGTLSDQIIFQKSGVGANPVVTAGTGTGTLDGIIVITGGDYITFDGIDLQENSLNTDAVTQMEWGYALLKRSDTDPVDGSRYVTIKNSTVTLNKENTSTWGIYGANHTASSSAGLTLADSLDVMSYCKFFSNTITNSYNGIRIISSTAAGFLGQSNEVGVDGGNIITEYGNASTQAYAMNLEYQNNLKVANNSVSGGGFSHSGTLYGIRTGSAANANLDIYNNTVSIIQGGSSIMYAITNSTGSSGTDNKINIYNNIIENCQLINSTTNTMWLIYNLASCYELNIYGNILRNNTKSAGTGTVYCIYNNPTSPTVKAEIYDNEVYNNSSAGPIHGINVTSGSNTHIYKNKIYDIRSTSSATTFVTAGITIAGGTSTPVDVNVFNNFISDLKAPSSASPDAIRGINITGTTANATRGLYYNTIFLNAVSGGANFGTSGIYHTYSATATSSVLDMRNNIVINNSTPNGTGKTAAFRRSGSTNLNNYSEMSNNNSFYAGTPGASRVIFFDGTNFDETINDFRSRVAPRETSSFTENVAFVNSTTAPYDLHVNPAIPTQTESGGTPVSSPNITTDFDGDTRHATAPDVGADEFIGTGIDITAPFIGYTPFDHTTLTTDRTLTDVTITDGSGINVTGGTAPRIYYKKYSHANTFVDNTSSTNGWKYTESSTGSSPFQFLVNYSLLFGGAGVQPGDTVQYFVVAQDLASPANVGISDGTFANAPSSVNLTAAAFPVTGSVNFYRIQAVISGTVTVGSGGNYSSLTGPQGLFVTLNENFVGGSITAQVTSDITEPGTNGLNEWLETGDGNYTLTIQPGSAVMRTISGSSAGGLIRINGADKVTIDGRFNGSGNYLTFQNTNAVSNTAAINVISLGAGAGATDVTIRNCNIKGSANSTTNTFALFVGAATLTTSSSGGADNHNISILENNVSNARVGIFARGTANERMTNLVISGNVVGSDLSGEYLTEHGINVQGAIAPVISFNEVYNLYSDVSKYGLYFGTNITNASVSKNRIHSIDQPGTGGFNSVGINFSSNTGCSDNTIDNNMIYNLNTYGNTSMYLVGIRIVGGSNYKIYFNSVSMTGAFGNLNSSIVSSCLYVVTTASTNMDIRNNIFLNTRTGNEPKNYTVHSLNSTTFLNIDYNDYWTTGNIFGYFGADVADFDAWKTATGQDANSINTDPMFTSSTDLHINSGLTPTALESGGTVIAGFDTDFDGDVRPGPAGSVNGGATAPDIGADEFDGVPGLTPVIVNVNVMDGFFDPSDFTVQVGDFVKWTLVEGNHTTTSNTIPPGAAPWDYTFAGIGDSYTYLVTTAGNYSYECSFHPGMVGTFTALDAGTFQLTVDVTDGWNMVSIPGLHPVDQNVDTWWPNRNTLGDVYKWSGGYASVTTAVPTEGYWMIHTGDQTYNSGDEWPAINTVAHDPIAVFTGWNLIGAYDQNLLVSGLTTTPPGLIVPGTVYGWNGTYYSPTNLEPGYGYWVLLSGDGVINATPTEGGTAAKQDDKEDWGRITVTDASGKRYTLYSVNGEVNLDHYQMPPFPPTGSFDVRYSSGRKAEDLKSGSQTIEMRGMEYPVTVSVENANIKLQDETGKSVNARLKPGEEIKINSSQINKLIVSENLIPDVYSLEQNYPNPFNPTTVIQFSIPEDAKNVRLTIYNALGQRVAELVNGSFEPGIYQYHWNAVDFASGLYIYELRTEKFVSVKKMMLMK